MKKAIILACTVFLTCSLFAQTHYEDWNKISISKKITPTFSTILDINFRQQANYKAN